MNIHTNLGLVGDALAGCHFLYTQSKIEPITVGPNLCNWVADALDFPITFDSKLEKQTCRYSIDASSSFNYCSSTGDKHHMAEGHYLYNHLPAPPLPYLLPMKFEYCPLEPGIVFAPFSRSDYDGNKFWQFNNWVKLSKKLPEPIYVVGSKEDDVTWTTGTSIQPVLGNSCAFINSLLIKSKLLISIDTGISHLAHALGISKHALLYPAVLAPKFVTNPLCKRIRGWPASITVDMMFHLCQQVGFQ